MQLNQLPPEFIKKLADNAALAKLHLDLINVHNKLLEKIEILNKKGDKGDAPTEDELVELIKPLLPEVPTAEEIMVEVMKRMPTKEEIIDAVLGHVTPMIPKPISDEKITSLIKPHIPAVKDVKSPKIDLDLLAQQVMTRIKIPKPEAGKAPEITDEMIIGAIKKSKKKLSHKDIDGLEQTIHAQFNQLVARGGYLHGGGVPSLIAGSNIVLTKTSDGGYSIASTGGGSSLSVLAVTGTVDDNNTTFTVASAPTLVAVNGVLYRTTGDSITWTYTGGTLTLSQAVGSSGSIYALG